MLGAVNRWGDRLLGIVLGLVIGIAIVAVFVFVFSEDTVDAPSIEGGTRRRNSRRASRNGIERSAHRGVGRGLAAVVVLFVVLSGGDDDEPATTAASTTTTTEAPEPEKEKPEKQKPKPKPKPEVPTIEVKDGQPVGGVQELEFEAGSEIVFQVTSNTDMSSTSTATTSSRASRPEARPTFDCRPTSRACSSSRSTTAAADRGDHRLAELMRPGTGDAGGATPWRRLRSRGSARRAVAFPAVAGRARRAGRQGGPADPRVALRLGSVAGPDRLLRRPHAGVEGARFEEDRWRPLPDGLSAVLTSRATRDRPRASSASSSWASSIYSGLKGTESPDRNFALTFVFSTFWLGLVVASSLVGRRLPRAQPVASDRAGGRRRLHADRAASRHPLRSAIPSASAAGRP